MKFKLCVTILFMAGALSLARTEERSGVEGFVTSDLAASVPGAVIRLDSSTMGIFHQTITNASGYYLFDNVAPGAYSLEAEVKGVGCIIYPRVAVFAGKRLRQDFHFERAKRKPDSCDPVGETGKK